MDVSQKITCLSYLDPIIILFPAEHCWYCFNWNARLCRSLMARWPCKFRMCSGRRFCNYNDFRDQKSYLNAYHKHFYLVVIVMQHLVGVLLWRWLKETKSRQENWRLVWIKMQYYGFPFGIHQIGHCWDTHVELFQINIYKFIPWF